ncbi:MAG: PilZ domain-containing protein [Mariprofundus sp.]|nr:PilZ domain-containing protein [Mariprofundus sp.]
MNCERRVAERFFFERPTKGEHCVSVGDKVVEKWVLLDVSPFGTRLASDEPLALDSILTLHYRYQELDITVFGKVVWSVPAAADEGGGFRAGVQFLGDSMALNVALCKAMVKEGTVFY